MTLPQIKLIEEIGRALKERHLLLAIAESCTGGGLCYYATRLPGSSDWFERGFITYSNASKITMLGVNPETLASFGAVSEQTACEMAEGALTHSNAHLSIAITGIAGPEGGSPQKPVGTVWIAVAQKGSPTAIKAMAYFFSGDRESIRAAAIDNALKNLSEMLEIG